MYGSIRDKTQVFYKFLAPRSVLW